MDYNNKKVFIIISVIVGLILAGLLFWIFFKKNNKESVNTTTGNSEIIADSAVAPVVPEVSNPAVAIPTVKVPPAEFNVEQLAKVFVERLLSYSNQNNNAHISDVLPLTNEQMATWVKKQSLTYSPEYQGLNTRVITSSIKEIKGSSAIVLVDIQQIFEGKETKVEYKSGWVELEKFGEDWKVAGLYWDK